LRAGGDKRRRGVVEVELGSEIAFRQGRLAIDIALFQVDALLSEVLHLPVDLDVGHQIVIGGAGLGECRLGLSHSELERHRVDLEQHVAIVDALSFAHHHLFDLARNVWRDQNLLRADIGIVSGHITAAIEIEHQASGQRDQRQHHKQKRAAITSQASHDFAAARLSCGGRRRRVALLLGREFENWISHIVAPFARVRPRNFESRCARFP
jgi:hypothetical protein